MKKITLLGIDIAKEIFQLHGIDEAGTVVLKKKLKRAQLLLFIAQLEPCVIAMEACGGSNYWAREFIKLGHTVKLISPQFVKPFVKTNKNDANDAEAITEAASRPNMRFVPIKTKEQQDVQCIHRVRERLIKNRTALVNEMRGLLAEYGVVAPKGITKLRTLLPEIIGDGDNKLHVTDLLKELCSQAYEELKELDGRIEQCNHQLEAIANTNSTCQRLMTVPGVGTLTATIMFTVLNDPSLFKNGRHFAAFLGLVPRQYSSGGKQKLYGISKRGDKYIRKLLVQGARAVLQRAAKKDDKRSLWINKLNERRGGNRTCVAIANKNARIVWALAKNETEYKKAA